MNYGCQDILVGRCQYHVTVSVPQIQQLNLYCINVELLINNMGPLKCSHEVVLGGDSGT